jgi:hypothetical protein
LHRGEPKLTIKTNKDWTSFTGRLLILKKWPKGFFQVYRFILIVKVIESGDLLP